MDEGDTEASGEAETRALGETKAGGEAGGEARDEAWGKARGEGAARVTLRMGGKRLVAALITEGRSSGTRE